MKQSPPSAEDKEMGTECSHDLRKVKHINSNTFKSMLSQRLRRTGNKYIRDTVLEIIFMMENVAILPED